MEFEFYHISFVYIYISNMFPFKIIKISSHDAINVIRESDRKKRPLFGCFVIHIFVSMYLPLPATQQTETRTSAHAKYH